VKYLISVALPFLAACGTITTLARNDESIYNHLKNQRTYCESIPRVYSGVAYDFCTLHSNPNNSSYYEGVPTLILFDIVASAAGDTLALPYSIYAQSKYNSIELRR
jgi:uncharacterized protein YceK